MNPEGNYYTKIQYKVCFFNLSRFSPFKTWILFLSENPVKVVIDFFYQPSQGAHSFKTRIDHKLCNIYDTRTLPCMEGLLVGSFHGYHTTCKWMLLVTITFPFSFSALFFFLVNWQVYHILIRYLILNFTECIKIFLNYFLSLTLI